ncbi:MAG: DNA-formamidopyrimidine glycosylase family protein [Anaerolineales bacterium]
MFELPEYQVLVRQINATLAGKIIRQAALSNVTHKFVWHNLTSNEFGQLCKGKKIGKANARGRWLTVPVEPGYVLVVGECGGKLVYQEQATKRPSKFHLLIEFEDGSFLFGVTQMWGAYDLYPKGEEKKRKYIKDMRPTPLDRAFTFKYFGDLMIEVAAEKRTSAKGLLTQAQWVPGLGNAIAQDILFKACLHPRHNIASLGAKQKRELYDAILATVNEVIKKGGRYDEYDLFGQPGQYVRLMDKRAVGRPCPQCGAKVEKIAYLGGACYFCPHCQV